MWCHGHAQIGVTPDGQATPLQGGHAFKEAVRKHRGVVPIRGLQRGARPRTRNPEFKAPPCAENPIQIAAENVQVAGRIQLNVDALRSLRRP